ncbi:pyridoxamine 5'-phosphate oxidase family protein [Pseudonocardia kujensis]|uniref:pyridoxamine 5'-phosphate oxidase family protein n=1 Tax=Pseudonocardia kujensis TaxID=1128675 RepID=UPI001E554D30|nr:pyridoxamine 5'-phosphate oxidase family protein [Pseudonocardia kujensis]MCE0765779.1 pyridoxamine 5'-phosphate oxidase family protein [Pseudonocardia kujensis]
MSIAVPTAELAATVARYDFAYLVTIGDDGRPHVTAVSPVVTDAVLVVGDLGRRTRGNLAARPVVTLVWPPGSAEGYSLIVDGGAGLSGDSLVVTPTRAVLHRPAPAPGPGPGCGADCVEIPAVAEGG